jgi:hypothetical protein
MVAACRTQIPFRHLPAHVVFLRDGHRLTPPTPVKPGSASRGGASTTTPGLYLQAGDEIRVGGPKTFTLRLDGNRYRVPHGVMTLRCRPERIGAEASGPATDTLLLDLHQGEIRVKAGPHSRRAAVVTPEMLAFATQPHTHFSVTRNPQTHATDAQTFDNPIMTARASDQAMRDRLEPSYTGISDRHGIRTNVWPFSLSPLQRPVRASDNLSEYWDDGQACATGCAGGFVHGWPLKPFHQPHPIRAGIDEIRGTQFHVAVDIQATTNEPVYAIQSGIAEPAATGSYGDYKVTVGSFTYWHIVPSVSAGQYVTAYKTVLGHVENGHGHIAFSEGPDDGFLNPLRPGGPLSPYTDTLAPIIGHPDINSDGDVVVAAFDPQSVVHRQSYLTPVTALAGLAWRLYNAQGKPLTGLEWALRASGYLPPSLLYTVFTPGSYPPGYTCFATQFICKPNWVYNLAGGLTEPLPLGSLRHGRYRLTVYAEDFKGNKAALDDWFTTPLRASAANALRPPLRPLDPQADPFSDQ